CPRCGRDFEWRAKWASHWEDVRYCSERCRRRRLGKTDRALEAAIVELLEARRGSTICPSEAARRVSPNDWRGLMGRTRDAARRLVSRGHVEILQQNRVVDPTAARGPIRLRLTARRDA
ncbi:MAG: DUF2256 and DUF3253 domain-containing protein, partial [Myxococcota bacterium]